MINNKIIFCLLFLLISSIFFAQSNNASIIKEYTGSINNKLIIKMKMEITGNEIKGNYYYEKIKQNITVKGLIKKITDSKNKQITQYIIEEFDEKGNKTGLFTGNLSSFVIIKGNWSSPDGKKIFPFILNEVKNNIQNSESINGTYDRGGDAAIEILLLNDGNIRIKGSAVWVMSTSNVHTGEFEGVASLKDGIAVYKSGSTDSDCKVIIKFIKDGIEVEDNLNCGGLNVTFTGDYKRTDTGVSGQWNEL